MRSLRDLMNLQGRVALITGGAGHIGISMARALAELGAAVVLVDMKQAECEQAATQIATDYSVQTLPIVVDLANETAVRAIPGRVAERFERLDILINNAALVGTTPLKGWGVPFLDQNADTWRQALEINLTVPFVLTQSCTPLLIESGHGSIINISSIYGIVGPQMSLYEGTSMGNPAAYAASKAGLIQFTRWLATTLAPQVRANAITLGGVWRHQDESFVKRYESHTPLGRMATEEDFNGAVAYLASDLSGYVTGHNLVIDGGWSVW